MCGIFGVIPGLRDEKNHIRVSRYIIRLALANAIRGEHSTGLANFSDNGKVIIFKEVRPSWMSAFSKEFTEISRIKSDTSLVIGHTRLASLGTVNLENAHPHVAGRYVAVHNGTILNHTDLYQTPTDSIALVRIINDLGFKALRLMRGHATMIIVDRENPGRPLFWISGDRPIHFYIDKHDNIIISSEKDHIMYLLGIKTNSKEEKEIFTIGQEIIAYFNGKELCKLMDKIELRSRYTSTYSAYDSSEGCGYIYNSNINKSNKKQTKPTKESLAKCIMCDKKKQELFFSVSKNEINETITALFCKQCMSKRIETTKENVCNMCSDTIEKDQKNWHGFNICKKCFDEKEEFSRFQTVTYKTTHNKSEKHKCISCGKNVTLWKDENKSLPLLNVTECTDCEKINNSNQDFVHDMLGSAFELIKWR